MVAELGLETGGALAARHGGRAKRGDEFWGPVRADFEAHGLTRAGICLKHGISDDELMLRAKRNKWNGYRGSVLGRQELEGELIEDRPDALWSRRVFEWTAELPGGRRVVAVDPPAKGGPRSDAAGIVIAGREGDGAIVVADWSFKPAPPMAWAKRAVRAFEDCEADLIVAEANQGAAITASFEFDVPVRFDTDRLDVELSSFDAAEAPVIPLIEVNE